MGGLSANSSANECAETPPTPDPSPPRAARAGGGEKKPFVGRIGAHRVRAERGPMAGSGVIRRLGNQDGGSRSALRAIKSPQK